MYRIALCDDDEKELENADKLIAAYNKIRPEWNFTTLHYNTAESMIAAIEQGKHFDILLLDIYLPGKTGIDGYKELRKKGFECPVIFLTTSLEHGVEAFQVNAVQYLVKPVEQVNFFAAMDKVVRSLEEERRRYITLKVGNGVRRIGLREILYTEAQKNYQLLRLIHNTEILTKMTLGELWEILMEFPDFVRLGRTYIVNLGHVKSVTPKEIEMINGQTIWMPRGAFPEFRKQYFEFYCER